MQRSAWKRLGLVFLALAALAVTACAEEGVGDPCTPETVPGSKDPKTGMFTSGFQKTESYIESSSVQCRSRLCIVHKLDNGSDEPADPRPQGLCKNNNNAVGCVKDDQLDRAVHCTCKCGGPKTSEQCKCPSGFKCTEILTLGGDGIRGNYCVKPPPNTAL